MAIEQSGLLEVNQLEGLARLVQGGGFIDSDDLVKVLDLLNTLLQGTHEQSTNHRYKLTMALSHVLDAMADAKVEGLARKTLHEPLKAYLDEMRKGTDPYLVYQAAYAYQALLRVPDDETPWQAALRRTGKIIKGVAGLVSAVKGLDLNKFFEGVVEIQQGAMDALDITKAIWDTYKEAMDLAESGKDFIDCMKEGFSFSRPRAWYSALRGADTLIRDGLLADFRKLVCEVPCRRDPAFLWGVCERLGEIAANSVWEPETRKSAILFLGEIYRDDAAWGRQPNLKQWILNILMQLSSLPGSEMQFAETQLQELQINGDAVKQALYLECREKGHGSQPLLIALPAMGTPSLLDRAQEKTDVEGSLRQLRRQRLKERGNAVYIQPQAKASLQARDESRFPLMEKVDEFLKGDQKVFLLLGDSGAGKSTFNRELEYHLWQDYKKGKTIPLFITLPALDKPEHDMIAKQLRKAEFTEPQIRELKFNRKFTLICDGYDESKQIHNLYMSNRLNQPGEWKAVMIISCRSEYVGVDYRDRFQPVDRNHRSEQSLFQEAVMTPFGMEQVHDYIKQYVDVHRPLWEADQYENALNLIPSLKELVKNPFLMSLSLDVLPRIVDPGQDLSATHITRMALYDQFIEHWLERGKKRLGEKNLSPQARSAFESLIDDGFTRNGIDYLKKLSAAIYKQQGGQPIVSYSRYKDENSWKAPFFSREEETHLLREACPLIRNGNQHRFIHRSLLEYSVTLAIFDPEDWRDFMVPTAPVAQKNTRPTTDTSGNDPTKEAPVPEAQEPDSNSPLYWRSFVDEPAVLQFLEERVRQEPLFEKQLFDYIEHSRKHRKWSTAAANAITILIRAGHQFNGVDLRGIRIPHADLSYGMFEEAQFEGADLSYADLRGVQFGELPYLNLGNKVWVSVYSPDGTTMAIGLHNGKITMYSTSNWEPLWSSQEHSKEVVSISYSPTGDQIASGGSDITIRVWDVQRGNRISALNGHGNTVAKVVYSLQGNQLASASYDKTVKLWDVKTGECSHTWTDHTDLIEGVVYSPKRKQIASNSRDGTVRLWDTESKKCLHVLSGHSDSVESVSYSPEGDQLASGSKDSTVRLWDVASGNCLYVLNHGGEVYSIAFSPKGDQFASGGFDGPLGLVRLWDVERGVALRTLRGHTKCISKVVYSPHGNLIASASLDKTTRVWDLETGACRQTLSGHSGDVSGATFSPKGDQVASYSEDGTVRLYEVGVKKTETSQYLSSGHVGRVTKVEYSPKGKHIATCGKDMTVRFWDFQTGICRQILRGHKGEVTSMAYSPEGDQIASGSTDKTVRLWIVDRGTCIHTLTGHEGAINHVTYLTGGNLLASSSRDKTIRLWDTRSGECRYTLTGHTIDIHRLQYLPNRNQVVSASIDSTIRIWDAEKGVCKHVLSCPEGVMGISYSPQGDRIASANGLTVRVWDVESGTCLHTLSGHKKGVFSVKYSPGGEHIASGDLGGTVIVWNIATKASLWTLTGHTGSVSKLEYSTQGHVLVSASTDKSVRVWNMATGTGLFAIQNYPEEIRDIDWIEVAGTSYLVTALEDGMVETSRLKPDMTSNSLCWRTAMAELDLLDTSIESIQGLDVLYEKLFLQRGARGAPLYKSREEPKKALAMGVVMAKLGTPVTLSHVQPPPPPPTLSAAAATKSADGVSAAAACESACGDDRRSAPSACKITCRVSNTSSNGTRKTAR
ncbi:hypothetical protein BGX34_002428 [Mortierella sp. NVP85]|nr:hypothetical protein BGX34_002428 [Mortierella sp. NVP85]